MCILFRYANPSPKKGEYKLILIMNRDEFFDRPTSFASWENDILCGRDEKEVHNRGGTWCGINKHGKIGCLTNLFTGLAGDKKSRGSLIKDFLKGEEKSSPLNYLNALSQDSMLYNPFNLLLMAQNEVGVYETFYYTPGFEGHISSEGPALITDPFIGLSNHPLSSPYRKTSHSLPKFEEIIKKYNHVEQRDELKASLFDEILSNVEKNYPDPQIEKQCLNKALKSSYNHITSCFVQALPGSKYATRTQTLILVDHSNQVSFTERNRRDPQALGEWETLEMDFQANNIVPAFS